MIKELEFKINLKDEEKLSLKKERDLLGAEVKELE